MDRDSSAPDPPPAALPLRAAGVILAAGAGSRFGGDKLVASLQGRPILRHVLYAAVRAGLDPIVVVEPPSGALRDLDLTPARRVINPRPEEGLSSSVRLGLREVAADAEAIESIDAAVILPGDQPLIRPETIRAVADAAVASPGTPFVVARHAGDRTPNPVLARRAVWRLADELVGDRGFGPVLSAHPELVREVETSGANPDVDTPADLSRLAEASPDASAGDGASVSREPAGADGDVS